MLLKNVSRRLITVNMPVVRKDKKTGNDVTKMEGVKILPGNNPAVEFADDFVNKNKFIKALVKDGSLTVQLPEDDEPETATDDLSSKSKDELLTIAKMIDPDAKGTKAQLIAIINGESE